jgi:hypothetical protein
MKQVRSILRDKFKNYKNNLFSGEIIVEINHEIKNKFPSNVNLIAFKVSGGVLFFKITNDMLLKSELLNNFTTQVLQKYKGIKSIRFLKEWN